MQKKKAARLAGFIGALCASGALVGIGVAGTGAYFTDSHDGYLVGDAGHLTVSTTDTAIHFTNLIPGEDQSQQITFTPTSGSPNEDVWMVFDTTSAAYGEFTGANNVSYSGYDQGGLGGYGHFKVAGGQGGSLGFESYNLQLPATASNGDYGNGYSSSNAQGNCTVNQYGDIGSTARAVGTDNATQSAPECGVPGAIKIASNLPAGFQGSATVTFGLTGKATTQNVRWVNVPFKIVATQVGHGPNDPNF
ncbi:MAG TPA: hypothetical protein VFL65_10710 [Jatrophihabitans sp.]|nr:hypothetical protein [Jatrophihabitans sp.]